MYMITTLLAPVVQWMFSGSGVMFYGCAKILFGSVSFRKETFLRFFKFGNGLLRILSILVAVSL